MDYLITMINHARKGMSQRGPQNHTGSGLLRMLSRHSDLDCSAEVWTYLCMKLTAFDVLQESLDGTFKDEVIKTTRGSFLRHSKTQFSDIDLILRLVLGRRAIGSTVAAMSFEGNRTLLGIATYQISRIRERSYFSGNRNQLDDLSRII